jgi:hypothetical protein
MNSFINLSAQQLRKAANIKERIDSLQNELARVLGSTSQASGNHLSRSARIMSAAGRARISAAAKKRWAKLKRSRPSRGKRTMSAAARARLSAVARARWKKAKAEGKKAL